MTLLNFFRSTIGLKIIMGLTGLAMFGFVVGHMVGNWQMFLGPEVINAYAEFLHNNIELIWVVRLSLVAIIVLHIWAAVTLSARNRAAKAETYATGSPYQASVASRTMMYTGMVLLAFIVFHLFHFTIRDIPGLAYPASEYTEVMPDGGTRFDVYKMMVDGFRKWWVSGIYILGMAALGFHLSHGFASAFRSLGLMSESYRKLEEYAAAFFAALLFVGFSSMPFLVLTGVVGHAAPGGPGSSSHRASLPAPAPPAIALSHSPTAEPAE